MAEPGRGERLCYLAAEVVLGLGILAGCVWMEGQGKDPPSWLAVGFGYIVGAITKSGAALYREQRGAVAATETGSQVKAS